MNIFVSGATGVLGRPVVRKLVAAGHQVKGLSHSPAKDSLLRELGAESVVADLFDVASLTTALAGCEAVLHLATRIPPTSKVGQGSAWAENDRIRREGTQALVEAALAADIGAVIYPSFAFVYPDSGDAWIDAITTEPAPTAILQSTLDAESAVARFAAAGKRDISLRMGTFYGLDVPSAQGSITSGALGHRRSTWAC